MRWLIVIICSLSLGCTATKDKNLYRLDLSISSNGDVTINKITSTFEVTDKENELIKQVGVYQVELKSKTKSALYGLPDLYLSHPGSYSFLIKSAFKVDSLKLYKMDGSSGHFTLKNQPSLESVKVSY